ncbi:site-specific integrase [Ideonella sp. A 288]|uniref:tyrosine-type recombinase/integrase n=1 Tax=Ideonella sp. A 288 TaxID=1962181 RepID=UPI0018FE997B|nr:site-specific integrase [Ideonella sp. A 288]
MPRKARELSALEVRRLAQPGRWSVGGVDGLALQVTAGGARSWVLRVTINGRQREMGLGSFPTVTLAEAREKARSHRALVEQGTDPISQRASARSAAAAKQSTQQTFSAVAMKYIAQHEKGWKNAKHGAQWSATLQAYAEPVIGPLLVSDVTTAHVIKVLEPIWTTKTETASRVRSRIELVLDFAAAHGLREGPNPARWRGNLDAALPKASKVANVQHHAAVPVSEMPKFMARLRLRAGQGARALEFAILTAARSGEVRGMTWAEVDLAAMLWTVPAQRMKGGREHRVPLSAPAMALLRALPAGEPDKLVLPGLRGPLSDMSLTAVLRRMGVDATAHGFRSSFRDWTSEHTNYPSEVAEMALAHTVANKVEAAYRRGDLFERRVLLMAEWAAFLQAGDPKHEATDAPV